MRVLVTGGAGFLGSHLCDAILARGDAVICVDNLVTGYRGNVRHLLGHGGFRFAEADVTGDMGLSCPVDAIVHLASPASSPHYMRLPLETMAAGSRGTENVLGLARDCGARFVLASTSEVYGDPVVTPQHERYWGNVNPIGPRSVYDEAKRFAEALTSAYRRELGVNTGIVRIFNTYGPRMSPSDGRVMPNFITQALTDRPLTVYGDGLQTRSLCYIDDLVRALVAMVDSAEPGPLNIGNPQEITIESLAQLVIQTTGSSSRVEHWPLPTDDPVRRCPAIDRARRVLAWEPGIPLEEGLRRTVDWYRSQIELIGQIA